MAASFDPATVLDPVPISFAPPYTEGVPIGTANPALDESKANDESPSASIKSKKEKKRKTDKDFPSVSSEFKRPDWLPQEWTIIERVRHGGKTAGMKDKYYIDPSTRKKFRSQVEVRRHLALLDDRPKAKSNKEDPQQHLHEYTEHETMQDEEFERGMQRVISENQMMYPNSLKSCVKDGASSSSSRRPAEAPMEEPKDVLKTL